MIKFNKHILMLISSCRYLIPHLYKANFRADTCVWEVAERLEHYLSDHVKDVQSHRKDDFFFFWGFALRDVIQLKAPVATHTSMSTLLNWCCLVSLWLWLFALCICQISRTVGCHLNESSNVSYCWICLHFPTQSINFTFWWWQTLKLPFSAPQKSLRMKCS